ncbi:MAG TPA: CheR family methyltransferase [Candidatus Binatia bacterium]
MTAAKAEGDEKFEALLEYLRSNRGFDFTGYKRPSLMRRVRRRMDAVSIATFADYLDYLEVHPEEFGFLFDTILINVTGFFRDPEAWNYLRESIVPRIIENQKGDGIRIWSAGCASGEEPYTIAMVFAEAMGEDNFNKRVKIYASDIDEEALATARLAAYPAAAIDSLSPDRKERFFERANSRVVFRSDLRRSVIFGRHDLVKDAPISRLDLLVCRNTLMYFNADTQRRVLGGFHFALNGGGVLFLGKAEMLLTYQDLFAPVDWKCRVFVKTTHSLVRERWTPPVTQLLSTADSAINKLNNGRLEDLAFDATPIARLVLNAKGQVWITTRKLRELFGLGQQDIGRLLQDLEISYRPIELRSLIEQAHRERRMITRTNVERGVADGQTQYFDVTVTPLFENEMVLGTLITFVDVTDHWYLQREVEAANKKLEVAYEELQAAHEELETTNEELQSTNEELQTTNEELQSSNEELETMNEELHSSNEELRAMNDMLRQRTDDFDVYNGVMDSVLSGIRGALAVLDHERNVVFWNHTAEETWGLRFDEVKGTNFFELDIGLNVQMLREPVDACLAGGSPYNTQIDATNRRGRSIRCRVSIQAGPISRSDRRHAIILTEVIDEGVHPA